MEKQKDLFNISRAQKHGIILFFLLLTVVWFLPIYSLLLNSLKVGGIENYTHVLLFPVNNIPFPLYFVNSFIVAFGSSALVVLIGSLAGFAFSKINFTGRTVIFFGTVMCLAVSGLVVFVPFFFILRNLHLYNTYWAVILPETVATLPFAVLMIKNYFDGLPGELMESAYMDGANIWQTFAKIFTPLAKPALINLGVLQVMWAFQDFINPTMYLTNQSLYTATVAIRLFQGVYGITDRNLGYYNAALVIIGIPAIVLFGFVQKYIVSGITSGTIKD